MTSTSSTEGASDIINVEEQPDPSDMLDECFQPLANKPKKTALRVPQDFLLCAEAEPVLRALALFRDKSLVARAEAFGAFIKAY